MEVTSAASCPLVTIHILYSIWYLEISKMGLSKNLMRNTWMFLLGKLKFLEWIYFINKE